jgi:FkbM family methyltransferase
MNLYKIFFLKLILFIGQRTFLGRGFIRKKLVRLIEFIIFSNGHQNLSNYKFICKILGVPFYFIFDKILDYKVYFCRSDRKEIFFLLKNSSDNTIFFDIGASMGIYTQFLAFNFNKIKNSRIIAVEPDPQNCDRIKMNLDLENNWMVVTEGIQTILRREKYEKPYEKLKEFSRGKNITANLISDFIDSLDVTNEVKEELRKITDEQEKFNSLQVINLQKGLGAGVMVFFLQEDSNTNAISKYFIS